MNQFHTPVLVEEVLKYLNVQPGDKYIDATVGGGGHGAEIIKHGGQLLGIDHDPQAIDEAQQRLVNLPALQPFKLVRGNFKDIEEIATTYGFSPVAGILFDLGPSSYQLTSPQRGFSFQHEAPLDMRMDPSLSVTAKDLVNALSQKELYVLFTKLAQEHRARAIAAAIVSTRRQKPIITTTELARLVEQVYQGRRFSHLHPATKVFQALRIAINDELNNLKAALPQALELLTPKGRLVVISFHEGEDRIVKHFFKDKVQEGQVKILTKKPVIPTDAEINQNPRSRSAKLRAAEKIENRIQFPTT